MKKGFSLIEVILASFVFILVVSALTGALIYGREGVVIAGNRQQAVLLAEEGLEAARNIRDEGFASLTDGNFGVATTSNKWALAGTSDTNGIYTRQVQVGTIDASRKVATSTVTWQQTFQRAGIVQLVSRFTNWIAASVTSGGLLIYGDGTNIPKYRTYDAVANTFGAETSALTNSIGRTFILRTSPTTNEAIAGFVTSAGVLNVMCYNGSVWSQEWTATVGGMGTTRRFDISYETNSGDAMVFYSTNTATNNELAYRTKSGASGCGSGSWAAATNLSAARTNGIVHWVKMAWDRRASSNLITAIWADASSDLSAMVWSGTAWGNEPGAALATNLDVVSSSQDVESFDVEYESLSGDVMIAWGIAVGNNTNGVRYATCSGGIFSCTWSGILTPSNFTDDAVSLDISANPNSDEIVFASIGTNQSDLQIGYWSGLTWTNTNNADTSCNTPTAGSKLVSTGWLISGATTRSIIRYADQGSSLLDFYTGDTGTFTKEGDAAQSPAPNGSIYFDAQMNPMSKDQIMFLASDSANDLFVKRLVFTAPSTFTWTNSDVTALELTLPQAINSPYSFAFWAFFD